MKNVCIFFLLTHFCFTALQCMEKQTPQLPALIKHYIKLPKGVRLFIGDEYLTATEHIPIHEERLFVACIHHTYTEKEKEKRYPFFMHKDTKPILNPHHYIYFFGNTIDKIHCIESCYEKLLKQQESPRIQKIVGPNNHGNFVVCSWSKSQSRTEHTPSWHALNKKECADTSILNGIKQVIGLLCDPLAQEEKNTVFAIHPRDNHCVGIDKKRNIAVWENFTTKELHKTICTFGIPKKSSHVVIDFGPQQTIICVTASTESPFSSKLFLYDYKNKKLLKTLTAQECTSFIPEKELNRATTHIEIPELQNAHVTTTIVNVHICPEYEKHLLIEARAVIDRGSNETHYRYCPLISPRYFIVYNLETHQGYFLKTVQDNTKIQFGTKAASYRQRFIRSYYWPGDEVKSCLVITLAPFSQQLSHELLLTSCAFNWLSEDNRSPQEGNAIINLLKNKEWIPDKYTLLWKTTYTSNGTITNPFKQIYEQLKKK